MNSNIMMSTPRRLPPTASHPFVEWLIVLLTAIVLLAIPCHSWTASTKVSTNFALRVSNPCSLSKQRGKYGVLSALSPVSSWVPSIIDSEEGSWDLAGNNDAAVDETMRWCQNFVLPLQLCPWAAASLAAQDDGAIQMYTVSSPTEMKDAIDSASRLFHEGITKTKKLDPSTAISFVVCEDLTWEFGDFYDWFCEVEESYWDIENDEDGSYIQDKITLAPFHPDWAFDGDDVSLSFEKKAPYPTVTLVWTAVIDAAGEVVTNKIAEQNEATLCDKGAAELGKMYQEGVNLKKRKDTADSK
jgi:hypothetical protein